MHILLNLKQNFLQWFWALGGLSTFIYISFSTGQRAVVQEWSLEMVILTWMSFQGKLEGWLYVWLNPVSESPASIAAFLLCCFPGSSFFFLFFCLNSNFYSDIGKENLANHLLGNLLQGQKRRKWIFWCAHNLRLILMKLELAVSKQYRISGV